MLGGGHVRRRSVGSMIEASPCVRIEKRKHTTFRGANKHEEPYQDSPNKARIIEKPSIASTSSYKFGGERMIKAQRGLLQRQSLEDSCLIADGEDLSASSEFNFLYHFSFVLIVCESFVLQCSPVLLLLLDRDLVLARPRVLAVILLPYRPLMDLPSQEAPSPALICPISI